MLLNHTSIKQQRTGRINAALEAQNIRPEGGGGGRRLCSKISVFQSSIKMGLVSQCFQHLLLYV